MCFIFRNTIIILLQLFLITNSPFELVNAGMVHMVGADWRSMFDVIIVQANKPSFFTQEGHFRYISFILACLVTV